MRRFLYITILLLAFLFSTSGIEARSKKKKQVTLQSTARNSMPDVLPIIPVIRDGVTEKTELPELSSKIYMSQRYFEGIDVSHYQGSINWKAVAATGEICYAYMKATEGESLVDRMYRRNIVEARRAGLLVGSYHFYRPNVSWKKQVANVIKNVRANEQDLAPIVDIEVRGRVSEEKFIRDLKQFIHAIEKHYGCKPLLYTYHNFYNKHLINQFIGYHWMIARYREDAPTLNDDTEYIMWQYTATGELEGVRGDVDRSCVMEGFRWYMVGMD